MCGLVFFDCGVLDVIGYLKLIGLMVFVYVEVVVWWFCYYWCVFIVLLWFDIYV